VPGPDLMLARGRPEPAVMPIVAIDAVFRAELAEFAHGIRGPDSDPGGTLGSSQPHKRVVLRPVARYEAAVPAARARTAKILLDDDDTEPRLRLFQADRRPEPEKTAADNADIGRDFSGRLFGCDLPGGCERFLEPE